LRPIGTGTREILLADAQTSGGLLVALPEHQAVPAIYALAEEGISNVSVIGKIIQGDNRISII